MCQTLSITTRADRVSLKKFWRLKSTFHIHNVKEYIMLVCSETMALILAQDQLSGTHQGAPILNNQNGRDGRRHHLGNCSTTGVTLIHSQHKCTCWLHVDTNFYNMQTKVIFWWRTCVHYTTSSQAVSNNLPFLLNTAILQKKVVRFRKPQN